MGRTARSLFVLGVALVLIGILSVLYLTLVARLPLRPDPATGYVVQFDLPETTHFITQAQAWLSERLPFIGICIGLVGVVLRRLAEARARSN